MPHRVLPHLEGLLKQISGVMRRYRLMLDDDLLFGAGVQVPQVATIFDIVSDRRLRFSGEDLQLSELLTLIAYRYGLEDIHVIGHGGYAIVLSAATTESAFQQRRVVRLVPDHHVRDLAGAGTRRSYDIQLDAKGEPIRLNSTSLLLSDLFLVPRHTTLLSFQDGDGGFLQAAGYPAKMHCQLLPEVRALNHPDLNPSMAHDAGALLEAALATLGVAISDGHGGNAGALLNADGTPVIYRTKYGKTFYVPVVIDYGYYTRVGSRRLAELLVTYGVTEKMVQALLDAKNVSLSSELSWPDGLQYVIETSELQAHDFGSLLLDVPEPFLDTGIWINQAEHQWQTVKERTYPPLQDQARLSRLYPQYDEVLFPQRIEEYEFQVGTPP